MRRSKSARVVRSQNLINPTGSFLPGRKAEAIAEAVQRPRMRFVPLKTEDQFDLQPLHRVRDRLVPRQTSIINQIRAFLLERGITFHQGRFYLCKNMPTIPEDAEAALSRRIRDILHDL